MARLEFGNRQPFIGLMGLRDVAGAADGGGISRLLELPGLGPVGDDAGGIVAGQAAADGLGLAVLFGLQGGDAEETV